MGGTEKTRKTVIACARLLALTTAIVGTAAPGNATAAGCPQPRSEANGPVGQAIQVDEGEGRNRLLYEESHALLIGETNYASGSGWRTLAHVPAELDALEAALRTQGFHVVRHEDLVAADLPAAIECFVKRYGYRRDARILIYFAGHGFTRTDEQSSGVRTVGYVLPVDAPKAPSSPGGSEETALIGRALRLTQFLEWASAMESRHVMLVFDSCFSGAVLGHRGTEDRPIRVASAPPSPLADEPIAARMSADAEVRPRAPNYVLSPAAQGPVRWFLTSGTANQTVPAESVFNSLLVQALTGLRPEADANRDGFLTSGELVQYLKGSVPDYNPDQTPDDGRIRDAMLDVGDMAFRLPGRQMADVLVQAAAAAKPAVFAGQTLDPTAVREIVGGRAAPVSSPIILAGRDETALAVAVRELESRDTQTRRKARATLSRLFASNGPRLVGELVRGLPHGSYRFQLGVAEALANAPGGWQADDQAAALAVVDARAAGAMDPSLKAAYRNARRNAR